MVRRNSGGRSRSEKDGFDGVCDIVSSIMRSLHSKCDGRRCYGREKSRAR